MNKNTQLELAFIERDIEQAQVQQRLLDGYINATALCLASGKRMYDYLRMESTREFIKELSSNTGIPASALIQAIRGGIPELQGTWVHPQVAINLAQWVSPKFAVKVSEWVIEWIKGGLKSKSNLPYHLQRYLLNSNKIPYTHFSVFNEIVYSLISPLEDMGYSLPDEIVPDISEGRVFCDWLRKKKGIDPSNFPTYEHEYADGRKCQAKMYPIELLPDFKNHFNEVWIMQRALKYFKEKDITALPYLQKIVESLPPAMQTEIKRIDNNKEGINFSNALDQALNYNPQNHPNDPIHQRNIKTKKK